MGEEQPRHWVGVASSAHVERGVAAGFCMFAHGKHEAVRRVRPGDWIVYYSPRTMIDDGAAVRAFTAMGTIKDGEPYQAEMAAGRMGWRRDVEYIPGRHADIYPLLGRLSFIKDPQRWGMAFRRGLFQVSPEDFRIIAAAMGVESKRL